MVIVKVSPETNPINSSVAIPKFGVIVAVVNEVDLNLPLSVEREYVEPDTNSGEPPKILSLN